MNANISICAYCQHLDTSCVWRNWKEWQCKATPEQNFVTGGDIHHNCAARNHDGKCQLFREDTP